MSIKNLIIYILLAILPFASANAQTDYVYGGERSDIEAGLTDELGRTSRIDTAVWISRLDACEGELRNEDSYRRQAGSLARLYEAYERLGCSEGCERCLQHLYKIADSQGDLNSYLQGKILQANTLFGKRRIKEGLDIYKDAEEYLSGKADNEVLTRLYLQYSNAFEKAGDYTICMTYIQKAIYNVDYMIQNPQLHCEAYYRTANLFMANEDYESAKPYIKGAITICEKERYRKMAAKVYLMNGEYLRKCKKPMLPLAYYAYEKCMEIMLSDDVEQECDNVSVLAKAYIGMAQTLLAQNQRAEALEYIKKALEQCHQGDGMKIITETYMTYGDYYMKISEADSAQRFYELALNNARMMLARPQIRDASLELSGIMAQKKLWEKAYEYKDIAFKACDYISKNQGYKDMVSWEINNMIKQKDEEKEEEIQRNKDSAKKSEGTANMMLALAAALIVMLAAIVVLLKKERKKSKLLEEKKSELEEKQEQLEKTTHQLKEQQEELRQQSETLIKQNSDLEKLSIVARQTDNSIFLADLQGHIIWLNEAFTKHSGYKIEDYLNANNNSLIEASSNPDIQALMEKIKQTKQPVSYTSSTLHKNGKKIWIQTTLSPALDKDGNITMFIAVCSDITKLKDAQDMISLQNAAIQESLEYARKIQDSIQAPKKFTDFVLGQYFVVNKPKDIVSGDFHWVYYKNDKTIFSLGDCTGHGVPGGFMSIMEQVMMNSVMNEISGDFTSAQILNTLRDRNIKFLHQGGGIIDSQDGMDASLFIFDRGNMMLNYAGGFSIAYIMRFGKPDSATREVAKYNGCSIVEQEGRDAYLIKLRPNRFPIGGHPKDRIPFDDRFFKVNDGDIVYTSSDGFVDQFGGPSIKKFSTVSFERLILDICHLPIKEQEECFLKTFNKWKGNNEQTDDVHIFAVVLRKYF